MASWALGTSQEGSKYRTTPDSAHGRPQHSMSLLKPEQNPVTQHTALQHLVQLHTCSAERIPIVHVQLTHARRLPNDTPDRLA